MRITRCNAQPTSWCEKRLRHRPPSESLCPRKAFLLMAGATSDPGPHDYELFIREQAEANRQVHRVRLAKVDEVVPFSGPADLAVGRDVLANVELATGVLQARCHSLTKVDEHSRLGRHRYE